MTSMYSHPLDEQPPRAPRWWLGYTIGALLIVLGVVLPCGLMGAFVLITSDASQEVAINPNEPATLRVDKPRPYAIWIDEVDTTSIIPTLPTVPSDFTATVTGPGGAKVNLRTSGLGDGTTTGSSGRSVAALFDAQTKGEYIISASATLSPNQSLVLSPDIRNTESAMGVGVLGMGCLGLCMFIGGVVTLIVTGVRHAKAPVAPGY